MMDLRRNRGKRNRTRYVIMYVNVCVKWNKNIRKKVFSYI